MATVNAINNRTQELTIDPQTTDDSFIQFDTNDVNRFRIGLDDDAADSFKISQGSTLGANDTFVMTTAGERTMPLQPAFLGILETTDSNVTGANTVFTIGSGNALTEVFDQNGDFNTNGTFTAPITARYALSGHCLFGGITAACTIIYLNIVTSNRTYLLSYMESGAAARTAANTAGVYANVLTDMDAADTAIFDVIGDGEGSDVQDILLDKTYICGYLVV